MRLRDYQAELIGEVRESLKTHKRVLAVLPCRAGKTVMFAYMAKRHADRGGYTWFLVHRRELVSQAEATFDSMGIPRENTLIAMVQTVSLHMERYHRPTMIIFDEAHHSSAATWGRIIERFPDVPIIGLTATPCRMDGKALGDVYQDMRVGISAEKLTEMRYLSRYDYYAPDISLDGAEWAMRGSDFDQDDVARTLDKPEIYGDAMRCVDPGRRTIVYCPTVAYSQRLAQAINDALGEGTAAHVDGELPKAERDGRIAAFRDGRVRVLTNCYLVGEGLDVPECDTVVMLRPTLSVALYVQQAMRCLTRSEGKRAIIYDLVGNVYRHGMPTDDREWSLTKPVKARSKSGEREFLVRECKECFRVYRGNARICPYCGHDNGMTRKEIREHRDAELKKIEALEKKERRREQGRAQTYDELVAIGKERGYKNPYGWAYRIMMSRRRTT